MIFRIYGLQLNVPKEYLITLWKGSHFFEGSVEIQDNAENVIRMDWNDLNKFIDRYKTPEDFFKPNIERVKQDRSVRDHTLNTYDFESDENHPYYFHKLSYRVVSGFPKREIVDYLVGLGVFCMNTNRFVLLQYRPPERGKDLGDLAVEIIRSFKCNCFE